MTTIDFNKLMADAGEGFQPVPPGPYHVEVSKSEATQSSTRKPQLKLQYRILDGAHAGRILFDTETISAENADSLRFFFDHMAALGLDRAYFAANPPMPPGVVQTPPPQPVAPPVPVPPQPPIPPQPPVPPAPPAAPPVPVMPVAAPAPDATVQYTPEQIAWMQQQAAAAAPPAVYSSTDEEPF